MAKLFRKRKLDILKLDILKNGKFDKRMSYLNLDGQPPFNHYADDEHSFDLPVINFNEELFRTLKSDLSRSEQAVIVFHSFPGLTPLYALDSRFWSYVCHVYARAMIIGNTPPAYLEELRVGTEDQFNTYIIPRFFPETLLHFRSRNPISKMWWNYKTAEVSCQEANNDWNINRALEALTCNVEVNQQLIEKRTFSRGHKFTQALLMELETLDKKVLRTTRPNDDGTQGLMQQFLIRINGMSGHLFLPAMNVAAIRTSISSIKKELGMVPK